MSEDNQANPTPQPAEVVAPVAPAQPKTKTPEDELANKLCIISLICYFGPGVLSAVMTPLLATFEDTLENSPTGDILALPIGAILALAPIAAIILMIVARVKAPKNTFAKVLMWVYIGLFILKILLGFLLLLLFGVAIASCVSGLN